MLYKEWEKECKLREEQYLDGLICEMEFLITTGQEPYKELIHLCDTCGLHCIDRKCNMER